MGPQIGHNKVNRKNTEVINMLKNKIKNTILKSITLCAYFNLIFAINAGNIILIILSITWLFLFMMANTLL